MIYFYQMPALLQVHILIRSTTAGADRSLHAVMPLSLLVIDSVGV